MAILQLTSKALLEACGLEKQLPAAHLRSAARSKLHCRQTIRSLVHKRTVNEQKDEGRLSLSYGQVSSTGGE